MAGTEQGCRSGQQPPTGALADRLAAKETARRAEHTRWTKELTTGRKAA